MHRRLLGVLLKERVQEIKKSFLDKLGSVKEASRKKNNFFKALNSVS